MKKAVQIFMKRQEQHIAKLFPLNLSPNKLISHSEKAVEVTLEYHATSQTLLRRLSLRTSGN